MGGTPTLPQMGTPGSTPPSSVEEWKSGSIPNEVSFLLKQIPPPSPLYLQRDDVLVLQAMSGIADLVTFNARFLSPDGVIESITRQVAGNALTPYVAASVSVPMREGYLLSVAAVSNTSSQRGQTFARAFIVRGISTLANPSVHQTLFGDYVTQQGPAGWPYGRVLYPTEGPGVLKTVIIAGPAAGVDWTTSVPANARWRIHAVSGLLTTAVAVANRTPRLTITDVGGNLLFSSGNNNSQVASTAVTYSYGEGLNAYQSAPLNFVAGLPDNFIAIGSDVIAGSTVNIQAADQWSLVRLAVEEWLDGM